MPPDWGTIRLAISGSTGITSSFNLSTRALKEIVAPAMSIVSRTAIPAGWYPDPEGSPQQRWWDGSLWTDSLAPYRSVEKLVDAATRATETTQSQRSDNSALTSAYFSGAHEFNEQQARATQLSFQSARAPGTAPTRSAHAATQVMTQEARVTGAEAPPFTAVRPT